jgi:hypothetical protein
MINIVLDEINARMLLEVLENPSIRTSIDQSFATGAILLIVEQLKSALPDRAGD